MPISAMFSKARIGREFTGVFLVQEKSDGADILLGDLVGVYSDAIAAPAVGADVVGAAFIGQQLEARRREIGNTPDMLAILE
jgi:hypothetical protein